MGDLNYTIPRAQTSEALLSRWMQIEPFCLEQDAGGEQTQNADTKSLEFSFEGPCTSEKSSFKKKVTRPLDLLPTLGHGDGWGCVAKSLLPRRRDRDAHQGGGSEEKPTVSYLSICH
jgi:hypothetical protein